jgi:hypothetical protein
MDCCSVIESSYQIVVFHCEARTLSLLFFTVDGLSHDGLSKHGLVCDC